MRLIVKINKKNGDSTPLIYLEDSTDFKKEKTLAEKLYGKDFKILIKEIKKPSEAITNLKNRTLHNF